MGSFGRHSHINTIITCLSYKNIYWLFKLIKVEFLRNNTNMLFSRAKILIYIYTEDFDLTRGLSNKRTYNTYGGRLSGAIRP